MIGGAVLYHGVTIPNGVIHRITDQGSPVKQNIHDQTETRQFRAWFTGSKIVNDDGTPKIRESVSGTIRSCNCATEYTQRDIWFAA